MALVGLLWILLVFALVAGFILLNALMIVLIIFLIVRHAIQTEEKKYKTWATVAKKMGAHSERTRIWGQHRGIHFGMWLRSRFVMLPNGTLAQAPYIVIEASLPTLYLRPFQITRKTLVDRIDDLLMDNEIIRTGDKTFDRLYRVHFDRPFYQFPDLLDAAPAALSAPQIQQTLRQIDYAFSRFELNNGRLRVEPKRYFEDERSLGETLTLLLTLGHNIEQALNPLQRPSPLLPPEREEEIAQALLNPENFPDQGRSSDWLDNWS